MDHCKSEADAARKHGRMALSVVRRALLATVVAAVSSAAQAAAGEWQLVLTPYVMLPGIDAGVVIDSPAGSPEVDSGPSTVMSLINMAVMLKVEAQRDRTFLFADWMYLDMGNAESVLRAIEFPDGTVPLAAGITLDSDVSFDGFTVLLAGGYRAIEDANGSLDGYAGLRTLNLSTSLRWSLTTAVTSPGGGYSFPATGELASSSETYDAVLGARGAVQFGERWRLFGLGDRGWGQGTESWQWALGLGGRIGSVNVELAWREIAWRGLGGDGDGRLRLFGPMIGATFRF